MAVCAKISLRTHILLNEIETCGKNLFRRYPSLFIKAEHVRILLLCAHNHTVACGYVINGSCVLSNKKQDVLHYISSTTHKPLNSLGMLSDSGGLLCLVSDNVTFQCNDLGVLMCVKSRSGGSNMNKLTYRETACFLNRQTLLTQHKAIFLVIDTHLSCPEGFSRISRWNFESPRHTSLLTPSWKGAEDKDTWAILRQTVLYVTIQYAQKVQWLLKCELMLRICIGYVGLDMCPTLQWVH